MLSVLAALVAAPVLAAPMSFQRALYYRADTRQDLYQVSDPRLREIAQSAAAVFESRDVTIQGATATLHNGNYGRGNRLCRSERFYGQPDGPVCSGTLIAPDIVLTAGHCVRSQRECRKLNFVFGYALSTPDADLSTLPAGDVYGCAALVARQNRFTGADWALVRLDRPVEGRRPAPLHWLPPPLGSSLVIAGYPSGLPLKVAVGARVTGTGNSAYFEADLDAFSGNSGSGVFLEDTGELAGVFVRGPAHDFARQGACRIVKKCTLAACGAQEVTRLSEILLPPALRPGFSEELSARVSAAGDPFAWPQ